MAVGFRFFFKKYSQKILPPKALKYQEFLGNNPVLTMAFNGLLTIKSPNYTHKVLTG